MKAIQTELGDREGKTGEVAELRKRIDEAGMPESTKEAALKELDRYEKIPELVQRAVLFAIILIGLSHYHGQLLQRIA